MLDLSVTEIQVPGYNVWIDPNSILKVEIGKESEGRTPVRIYLTYEDQPRVVEFATKHEALEFYETLWKLKIEADAKGG